MLCENSWKKEKGFVREKLCRKRGELAIERVLEQMIYQCEYEIDEVRPVYGFFFLARKQPLQQGSKTHWLSSMHVPNC